MKFLIILLSIMLTNKGCDESKINQDVLSIEYSESSRSYYKQIIINKKNISTVNKRDGKPISENCSKESWERIISTLKTIDIEKIPELEAPSKKFLFDGAAIARLRIIYNDTIYQTSPFDYNNPHPDIANLVKEILSISENIE